MIKQQTTLTARDSAIELIDKLLFLPLGLKMTNVEKELEGHEYSAHNFQLDGQNVKFRIAKITPTKTGQFVTTWRRSDKGITEPFNISDNVEFYVIATRKYENFGAFIFPKEILYKNKVLSGKISSGKRGIRVYPPWDLTTNKQAQKTQQWQVKYFIELSPSAKSIAARANEIFTYNKFSDGEIDNG